MKEWKIEREGFVFLNSRLTCGECEVLEGEDDMQWCYIRLSMSGPKDPACMAFQPKEER